MDQHARTAWSRDRIIAVLVVVAVLVVAGSIASNPRYPPNATATALTQQIDTNAISQCMQGEVAFVWQGDLTTHYYAIGSSLMIQTNFSPTANGSAHTLAADTLACVRQLGQPVDSVNVIDGNGHVLERAP